MLISGLNPLILGRNGFPYEVGITYDLMKGNGNNGLRLGENPFVGENDRSDRLEFESKVMTLSILS